MDFQLNDIVCPEYWSQLSFYEKMGNIGSEISRALTWRDRGDPKLADNSFHIALALIDSTRQETSGSRLRELSMAREVLCDYFQGRNKYALTSERIRNYYYYFAILGRYASSPTRTGEALSSEP